jgi:hypothetical protein
MDILEIQIDGHGRAAIRKPDLGFGLTWDSRTFPYLWTWEVCGGRKGYPLWSGEYIFALEPFNCPLGGLSTFAGKGILPTLKPGARRRTSLAAGFCSGRIPFQGRFLHDHLRPRRD